MKWIREPSFITYRLGASYSHFRGDWLFCLDCRLDNFKFGLDWYIFNWQLQNLSLYLGFFEFNWVRIYAKKKVADK